MPIAPGHNAKYDACNVETDPLPDVPPSLEPPPLQDMKALRPKGAKWRKRIDEKLQRLKQEQAQSSEHKLTLDLAKVAPNEAKAEETLYTTGAVAPPRRARHVPPLATTAPSLKPSSTELEPEAPAPQSVSTVLYNPRPSGDATQPNPLRPPSAHRRAAPPAPPSQPPFVAAVAAAVAAAASRRNKVKQQRHRLLHGNEFDEDAQSGGRSLASFVWKRDEFLRSISAFTRPDRQRTVLELLRAGAFNVRLPFVDKPDFAASMATRLTRTCAADAGGAVDPEAAAAVAKCPGSGRPTAPTLALQRSIPTLELTVSSSSSSGGSLAVNMAGPEETPSSSLGNIAPGPPTLLKQKGPPPSATRPTLVNAGSHHSATATTTPRLVRPSTPAMRAPLALEQQMPFQSPRRGKPAAIGAASDPVPAASTAMPARPPSRISPRRLVPLQADQKASVARLVDNIVEPRMMNLLRDEDQDAIGVESKHRDTSSFKTRVAANVKLDTLEQQHPLFFLPLHTARRQKAPPVTLDHHGNGMPVALMRPAMPLSSRNQPVRVRPVPVEKAVATQQTCAADSEHLHSAPSLQSLRRQEPLPFGEFSCIRAALTAELVPSSPIHRPPQLRLMPLSSRSARAQFAALAARLQPGSAVLVLGPAVAVASTSCDSESDATDLPRRSRCSEEHSQPLRQRQRQHLPALHMAGHSVPSFEAEAWNRVMERV
jgi:hypothetical protein